MLGKDSVEKNIPEKKIEKIDTIKLVTFPTLKIIIKDADIKPNAKNGTEK
tara:strand:- start:61 stop:210 length:150 start_codon:yes stop_codon:yes gene_type:complete